MLPAVLLAAVYLIWAPPSADLAAQTFRTELFEAHGFQAFSTSWYGGIHLPGYSLLFPPLASVLGVRLVGALAAIAAAVLFARIVVPRYGERARLAVLLFGLGSATNLFTGRLTFALGVAIALGAVLALDRGRPAWAGALAVLSAAASPVAALFLGFAGGVLFLRGSRREGLSLALPALVAIGIVALGFPTGGVHPFVANTFALIAIATVILVVLLPPQERTLRLGAALYLAFCLAVALVNSPIGGNATRLGALMAAPLFALGAWGRRPAWLVALALAPLLYWQWVAPIRDLTDAVGEPSVEASYYTPLLAELARAAPHEPFRVQVPPTRNRWEAVHVAEAYPLARGWLRQLESDDFGLFQDGNLSAQAYREWLDERGVAFVAVSLGAKPDYLSRDEIDLIHGGLPYLNAVWSDENWELYEVRKPAPLVDKAARITALTPTGFDLDAPDPGRYEVRVRFSPYFQVVSGAACVSASGDWTEVELAAPGAVRIEARLSLTGLVRAIRGAGGQCSS